MGQAKAQLQWEDTQHEQLLVEIAQAHREWTIAMEHFNNATAHDVVDDAIYLLIAAERRFEGLMRIARRQNLSVDLRGRVSVPSSQTEMASPVAWSKRADVAATSADEGNGLRDTL